MHKENDHAGAFLLLHGRYSVLAHYLKVSLKNSRFLKIPKLHPQIRGAIQDFQRLFYRCAEYIMNLFMAWVLSFLHTL